MFNKSSQTLDPEENSEMVENSERTTVEDGQTCSVVCTQQTKIAE